MNKTELLAPAGDLERLKMAFHYGADAVYLGGQNYSLRANAQNFSLCEIETACTYAHELGKKIYVTVNIVFHDEDVIGLEEYLTSLSQIGVDAIIFSDPLVISISKSIHANYELHLSTQASLLNKEAALFWKEEGISRLVLAREASKEDIIAIKKASGLELECFVHGAMCTSFSGRCVLSNYCTLRDSNRGGCAQICRWIFKNEEEEDPFSMTPKDLNLVSFVHDMIDIGVNSFKVEGRMRSIYYVATIMYVYRKIIDTPNMSDAWKDYYLNVLNRCANRESAPQFYDGLPSEEDQYFLGRKEYSNQDFLGLILSYEDGKVTLEERNYFQKGDIVEFFGPNHEEYTYTIDTFYDKDGNMLEVANHPQMILTMNVPFLLEPNDMMRKKIFQKPDEK